MFLSILWLARKPINCIRAFGVSVIKMTGNHAPISFAHFRSFAFANIHAMFASGMEPTALGRIDRAGHFSLDNGKLFNALSIDIGNCIKQRLGIRMSSIF